MDFLKHLTSVVGILLLSLLYVGYVLLIPTSLMLLLAFALNLPINLMAWLGCVAFCLILKVTWDHLFFDYDHD